MADVTIPRNDCGVGLDDLERVCAVCWGGHGDGSGGGNGVEGGDEYGVSLGKQRLERTGGKACQLCTRARRRYVC